MHARRDIGLIVNPIAGSGGPAGVRGTDTPEQQAAARAAGSGPASIPRAARAWRELAPLARFLRVWTGTGPLGRDAIGAEFPDVQVCTPAADATGAAATRHCITQMLARGIELLLFAGGDGTARDVLAARCGRVPVIGIPAGATLQSGVFAATPEAAGRLALSFLRGECRAVREQEVRGRGGLAPGATDMAPMTYGTLRVPWDRELVPGPKVAQPHAPAELDAVVEAALAPVSGGDCVVLGPGSIKMALLARLGLAGCLPGVDVVQRGRLLATDVGEMQLLKLLPHHERRRIIVTPVGGQGFLFGRGNQPLSARVIRAVGVDNVTVISTPAKLQGLNGRPLRIDLDDAELPRHFPLTIRVLTAPDTFQLHPLALLP